MALQFKKQTNVHHQQRILELCGEKLFDHQKRKAKKSESR